MKKWAWIVVLLYMAILIAFTLPTLIILFGLNITDIALDVFTKWPYWTGIFILLLSQIALLKVPVLSQEKRPITKRILLSPIIAAALMMGLLSGSFLLCLAETIKQNDYIKNSGQWWWITLFVLIITWVFWAYIFYRKSKNLEPLNLIEKLCRVIFRASILELLVAIPTHILARHRNYCCAGFGTFWGIAFGMALIVFSFGPGVYFLFVERWKKLHPQKI
jgi:hypothetical protein